MIKIIAFVTVAAWAFFMGMLTVIIFTPIFGTLIIKEDENSDNYLIELSSDFEEIKRNNIVSCKIRTNRSSQEQQFLQQEDTFCTIQKGMIIMDREKLLNQIARIQAELEGMKPGDEGYDRLTKNLDIYGRLLAGLNKEELDRLKLDKEFELRSKDQEIDKLRIENDKNKIETEKELREKDQKIEEDRIRNEKKLREKDQEIEEARIETEQAASDAEFKKEMINNGVKIGLTVFVVTGTLVGVVLTGAVEETCILKNKMLPVVTKI